MYRATLEVTASIAATLKKPARAGGSDEPAKHLHDGINPVDAGFQAAAPVQPTRTWHRRDDLCSMVRLPCAFGPQAARGSQNDSGQRRTSVGRLPNLRQRAAMGTCNSG